MCCVFILCPSPRCVRHCNAENTKSFSNGLLSTYHDMDFRPWERRDGVNIHSPLTDGRQ
jgi:hypothetical protein